MKKRTCHKKKRTYKKRTYGIVCLLFGILFFCCLTWLTAYFIGLKKAENEMNAIRSAYTSEGGTPGSGKDGTGSPGNAGESAGDSGNETDHAAQTEEAPEDLSLYGVTDRSIDWDSLQEEQNKDIYAWIVIPGTSIDYPVLQHPEEMDYYLEHNLDGSAGRPGCIYTQRMNSKDWSDRNTVVYGHNMWSNSTMFYDLQKFEDRDFFDDNRYIHIYSEDGRILVYEIFAAYRFSDVHLLLTYDFYTDAGYQQYLDGIRENEGARCNFQQETGLSTQDRIITLSTCIKGSSAERYLVQGVLIAEGEQP